MYETITAYWANIYLGVSLMLGLGRKYASERRNPYELDLLSGSSALRGNKFLH